MDEKRRDFLKRAGMGSLVGLGVFTAMNIVSERETRASTESTNTSGIRYGMVVDTRKCPPDCTKCIESCHSAHNVPNITLEDGSPDLKNEIKWIWKETYQHTFPSKSSAFINADLKSKEVMLLCNHCDNPSCVRVCPTKATFKRAEDGIIMMDFHRCIGCRFCMAACPYGSRSFNWMDPREKDGKRLVGGREINHEFPTRERGVVEKCNFCSERLAKDLRPACVESCTEGALTFGNLNDANSEIRQLLETHHTIQRKPELGTGPSVFYIV